MNTLYDSIDVSTIPDAPFAVAGYVGGRWPDFSAEVQRFPHAHHLSIAITASEDADCLDIETGDAVPAQAGPWAVRQIGRGVKRPVLYSDRSEHPAVVASVTAAGLKRTDVRYWIATLDNRPELWPDSDATQWTAHALGRNLDASLLVDSFFDTPPSPPAVNPPHYDWLDDRKRLIFAGKSERDLARAYDALRATQTPTQHPNRYKLTALRLICGTAARRVWTVAHQQKRPNGKPSWQLEHRGWRYQALVHRSQGRRLV